MHRKYYAVIWQLFFELLGFLLSVHNTFRDADVLRKVRQSHCLASCGWALFALIILGLFQVIHVKRAWARQLRSAEVLESLEDQDYMWITPVLGAERGLPVAIVTNIPAVPIMVYAFLLKHCFDMSFWSTQPSTDHSRIWWCEPKTRLETYVLGFSILSQLLVISFSVVDVDIGTSAFLARRYDVSRSMQGKTMMLRLYPFFHILGRISEVMARIAMLCSFLGIAAYKMGLLGAFTTCLVVLLDLAVLLMILQRYSPEDESIYIHFAVACGLLVADGARYVDRPGFCYPARCISRAVDRWHRLQFLLLIALFVVLHVTLLSGERQQEMRFLRCYPLAWSLVISLVVSEGLKCTALKVTGDDLHTAMLNHRISRVRKLLEFSLGGEVLDVNGPTKDSQQVTATMLGAQSGFVEGLRMIMSCGGKVEVRNSQGETCIHLAVRHVQLEALEFLVNQPGAKQVLRTCRAELMKLAAEACGLPVPQGEAAPDVGHLTRESSRLNSEDLRQLFLLLEPDRGTRRNAEVASSVVSLQNVSTHLAMSRHLLRLFPNADEEQAPELHELHSVSALLVAHGCGSLARLLLRRRPQMGLEQLKKVRTLGQGASGTVIEVECEVPSPVPRSSLRLRLQSDGALMETKRFAMKLQSKRNMHMDWQAYSEVVALRRCGHPFIVRLEQAFQTPHYYALLLELCPNGDVNQLLCQANEQGRYPGLPPERAARLAGQVLLALVHLHEDYGIIYRDVKPKNVLLSAHDEAKLADFGLALYVGKKFFNAQAMPLAGTPSFWAPELIMGEEGPERDPMQDMGFDPFKTDAYSFGVTLLLMLLGEDCAEVQADEDDCMSPERMGLGMDAVDPPSQAGKRGGRERLLFQELQSLPDYVGSERSELRWAATQGAFALWSSTGGLVAWGDPEAGGELPSRVKQLVAERGPVRHVQGSDYAFAAILHDGGVVSWGEAAAGGDCSGVEEQLSDVQQLCSSHAAFAALKADGTLVAWGDEGYGGTLDAEVEKLREVHQLRASASAFCALVGPDRRAVTWGDPDGGGRAPCELSQVQRVEASSGAFAALLADGAVVTWGDPGGGGDSSQVQHQLAHVQDICSSGGAFAALLEETKEMSGFLQPHEGAPRAAPTEAMPVPKVLRLAGNSMAFAAVRQDDTVCSWGQPEFGGDSFDIAHRLMNVKEVRSSITGSAFAAIFKDGGVVAWGDPSSGGDCSAVQDELCHVVDICASGAAFAALTTDRRVVTWGAEDAGGACPREVHEAVQSW
ncbi:unnamed protein product [Durusdinium trenchii]|uniref:mitogen-activated protein kinase kinase n=1 Tax=Durusdinium trenchii TaxID=1381693 RepID=A0ABP0SIE9_9DINO